MFSNEEERGTTKEHLEREEKITKYQIYKDEKCGKIISIAI